jgi:hypothetical protein
LLQHEKWSAGYEGISSDSKGYCLPSLSPCRDLVRDELPSGGIGSRPLVCNLLDAIHARGDFCKLGDFVPGNASVQRAAYNLLRKNEVCPDLGQAMAQKLLVTLDNDLCQSLRLPATWFQAVCFSLARVKQHVAMCVFKTFIGGWTTSVRMGEVTKLPCIFGCRLELDCQNHYIACSSLWQIAAAAMGLEAPLSLSARLCLSNPSPQSMQMLALVFMVYHYTKSRIKDMHGIQAGVDSNIVQRIAFESSRTFLSHIR